MKKYIPVLIGALLLAGCSGESPTSATDTEVGQVYTVEHDGYLFVVFYGNRKGGITPHPGCPKAKAERLAEKGE